ncbi:N-acetylglucosamine-6-phosphate deacetylase [Ponticoccus litoralis]|uniref:N-acetylglucosamine-6-phosphate deacetylase n=1 Tax=Ponticoccus litoralis TaxID=422297 RepID=A0AAW9SA62_9RHOB
MSDLTLRAPRVFDGRDFVGAEVRISGGRFGGAGGPVGLLDEGVLLPGFVDLQVNGGGGVMFDAAPTVETLRLMSRVHGGLGATTILPTVISSGPEVVSRAIAAVSDALRAGVPGIAGLHLEGPHLAPSKKGAHDGALIRPMTGADLAELMEAARALPFLMVTVAPEAVTNAQISALAGAGVAVSLGHTDCSAEAARAAFDAGARHVTHLFNAMSQMGARAPGLVGAALDAAVSAGVIADLLHVDPVALRVALAARDSGIHAVSDCMALAGSEEPGFALNGRRVLRSETTVVLAGGAARQDRLTLEDGTLAGACLTLAQSVRNLVGIGVPEARALAMVTGTPGAHLGCGRIRDGASADLVWLGADWSLRGVWRAGLRLA